MGDDVVGDLVAVRNVKSVPKSAAEGVRAVGYVDKIAFTLGHYGKSVVFAARKVVQLGNALSAIAFDGVKRGKQNDRQQKGECEYGATLFAECSR